MFNQLVTPVAESLGLSFLVAAIPIIVVLVMLGVLRRPAWQASLAGLIIAFVIAVTVWQLPTNLAVSSTLNGATFALWPVMWIVFNALVIYNIAVNTGRFDAFRAWVIANLPNDKRIVLVVIGFSFGALMEGVAGFGTPVAITAALLIALGFPALDALVFVLIFNTAPVAFGALGTPVTALAGVTQLPAADLGAMIGRQLPFLAVLLPFYVVGLYGGTRSIKAIWPVLLVSGVSFAGAQFVTSNYIDFALTDVMSALVSLIVTTLFLQVWKPAPDAAYALAVPPASTTKAVISPWQGWIPWVAIAAVVTIWTTFGVNIIGRQRIEWPGLHNQVFITVYNQPYAAIYDYQPLATGTAILLTSMALALFFRIGVSGYFRAVRETWVQIRVAILTVALIVGLAYLMNYAGMTYTLGLGVASVGFLFPLLSAFLGWIAVFLSGSDTSGNALFGNLQVVAANQLNLSPVLMAATNSSGGVMGKMISPQNIATGIAVTDVKNGEGLVLSRTFIHSIILTVLLGILVMLQQYVFPWMIPGGTPAP